ncbi:MAG: aminopeptidase P family protein, partial [Candidatus Omnitrophica bacterium]|nr:aminopeptidase P family protein [Candidatus Omnitrophota bacterium]
MNPHLKNAYQKLAENKLDGLLLSSSANISYLTDYRSRDSYFILSPKQNIYITDSRYTQEAKASLKDCIVKQSRGSVFTFIAKTCRQLGLKQVGFEERELSFAEYQKIKDGLSKSLNFIPTYGIIEGLRLKKDKEELAKIKKATQINIAAFRFIQDFIRAGLTELEIAGELERFIRQNGAYSSGFETIVASGPNSGFPHHITSSRKIQSNEPVL